MVVLIKVNKNFADVLMLMHINYARCIINHMGHKINNIHIHTI